MLYIFFETKLVGSIEFFPDEDRFSFSYDIDWIKEGFELSPSLKFSGSKSSTIKFFIENLLPEGQGLEELSTFFQISKSNKFGLLKAIGLDTAGALVFLPSHKYELETSFREISKVELDQRVRVKEQQPISIWDQKPRLSVAGVQEKLPLLIMGNKMGLGEGDLCSTHILKFNKRDQNVILNEYISLKLCEDIGLDVAKVEYRTISSENILFVKRFDREIKSDTLVSRRHIIDSVQALGLPVSYKYERNFGSGTDMKDIKNGVSWSKLFSLLDEAKLPIVFKERLIDWNIVNLCLGNSDAHGKNISFFVDKDGLEIAPFYDIVNITMYEGVYEQELAMGIDDEFTYEISAFSFQEFLDENDIDIKYYFDSFKSIILKIEKSLKRFDFIEKDLFECELEFCNSYKANIIERINYLSDALNRLRFAHKEVDESNQEFFDIYKQDIYKVLNLKKSVTIDVDSAIKNYHKAILDRSIQKLI